MGEDASKLGYCAWLSCGGDATRLGCCAWYSCPTGAWPCQATVVLPTEGLTELGAGYC